jgi:hypothetical protein
MIANDSTRALAGDLARASDLARVRVLAIANNHASALTDVSNHANALASTLVNDLTCARNLAYTLREISLITIELARVCDHLYRADFIVLAQLFITT